jgi:hypothetical protein
MTNRGVYITLPVIDLSPMLGGGLLAVLTCMVKETIPTKLRKFKKCVMVIPLYRSRTGADIFHRPYSDAGSSDADSVYGNPQS